MVMLIILLAFEDNVSIISLEQHLKLWMFSSLFNNTMYWQLEISEDNKLFKETVNFFSDLWVNMVAFTRPCNTWHTRTDTVLQQSHTFLFYKCRSLIFHSIRFSVLALCVLGAREFFVSWTRYWLQLDIWALFCFPFIQCAPGLDTSICQRHR